MSASDVKKKKNRVHVRKSYRQNGDAIDDDNDGDSEHHSKQASEGGKENYEKFNHFLARLLARWFSFWHAHRLKCIQAICVCCNAPRARVCVSLFEYVLEHM